MSLALGWLLRGLVALSGSRGCLAAELWVSGGGFFATLPWMPAGRTLWEALAPYHPVVLTGMARGSWAVPQKLSWPALGGNCAFGGRPGAW